MADVKTSAEDPVSGLSGDELVRIVQDGASVRTTAQAIADLSDNADAYNDAAAFDAFGDSITLGTGASDAAHRYANLISTRRGWTLTNHGVSGDMVADQASPVFTKVVGSGSQSTLMLGTNDQRTYQASLPKQDAFKLGHLALAAWLALADSKKVYGQAGALTGTWTNSVVYAAGLMKQSIVPASTATYTVYGTTVYIGSVLQNSIVATFSVAIDGVAKGTFSCAPVGVTITSVNALTYMPQLLRFPGLSEGAHTVVITVVTASAANPVYVIFVAGNGGARTKTGPNIWIGNVPRFTAAGYIASGGSDAVVASFNRMIRDNVRLLAGDGLNVALADSCANLNTAADIGGDGVHPDDSGHDVIAEAFLEAINQIQKPATVERLVALPQIVETETGTTYTFLPSDHGKLKVLTNAASIAATLPQAGVNFPNGWYCDVQVGGAGTVTITPTTSTIGGAATQALLTGQGGRVTSDNANYKVTGLAGSTVATGTLNIPQNSKSAAYTTVISDSGKHILHPSADTTARVFTIDSNANVAYDIGTAITFVNQNAGGVITISITSDTMRLAGAGTTGSRTLAANGIATALKLAATEWIISGTGLT